MMNSDAQIQRLRKLNGALVVVCALLGVATYIFYTLADRPSLSVYDDSSLQYSHGLWWKNEKTIYVYHSKNMDAVVVGYFNEKKRKLFDIAWITPVENEDEAIRSSQPLTAEERRKLYEKLGISNH